MTNGCQWDGAGGCTVKSAATTYCTTAPGNSSQANCTSGTGATDGCTWGGGCTVNPTSTTYCNGSTTQTACTTGSNDCSWVGTCGVMPGATSYCTGSGNQNLANCTNATGVADACTWNGGTGCLPMAGATTTCTGSGFQNATSCQGAVGVAERLRVDPRRLQRWPRRRRRIAPGAGNGSLTACTTGTGLTDACTWGGACNVNPTAATYCTTSPGNVSATSCTAGAGLTDGCTWNGSCVANATSATYCATSTTQSAVLDRDKGLLDGMQLGGRVRRQRHDDGALLRHEPDVVLRRERRDRRLPVGPGVDVQRRLGRHDLLHDVSG